MSRATVGKRYQVVIPLKERTQLGIRANTKVEIVAEGDKLVLYPLSTSRLKGIGIEIADGTDATDYVRKLRKEWEKGR